MTIKRNMTTREVEEFVETLEAKAFPYDDVCRPIQKAANRFARKNGYGKATWIVFGNEDRILARTDHGRRKHTTGQYVPNSYYQEAITVVEVDVSQIQLEGIVKQSQARVG